MALIIILVLVLVGLCVLGALIDGPSGTPALPRNRSLGQQQRDRALQEGLAILNRFFPSDSKLRKWSAIWTLRLITPKRLEDSITKNLSYDPRFGEPTDKDVWDMVNNIHAAIVIQHATAQTWQANHHPLGPSFYVGTARRQCSGSPGWWQNENGEKMFLLTPAEGNMIYQWAEDWSKDKAKSLEARAIQDMRNGYDRAQFEADCACEVEDYCSLIRTFFDSKIKQLEKPDIAQHQVRKTADERIAALQRNRDDDIQHIRERAETAGFTEEQLQQQIDNISRHYDKQIGVLKNA